MKDVANLPGARVAMDTEQDKVIIVEADKKIVKFQQCASGLYFFDAENGNANGDALSDKGREALKAFPYLNAAKAFGPNARHYLYSIEMLVDFIESRLS